MQWDASQRQDVPLTGAGGVWTICFCHHQAVAATGMRLVIFRRLIRSIPFWSCFSAACQYSFSSLVLVMKFSSRFQALNRCEDKYADDFWTFVREKIWKWKWKSECLRWLKHCFELLGGQCSWLHVCSWVWQTTGTVQTRLWWEPFSQPMALVLLGRFSHGLQNGEAKGFTCVANQLLESVAYPERLGIWRLWADMSSIWLLNEWAGERGAILVYVGVSSLSDLWYGFKSRLQLWQC